MLGFEALNNRYLFKGTITLNSPLHVGSGAGSARTDSEVMKDATGKPFIPGSSIKGVLRSTVERLAPLLPPRLNGMLWTCALIDGTPGCPTTEVQLGTDYRQKIENRASESDLLIWLDQHLCQTCRLFGSPFLGAKVKIKDAYLSVGANGATVVRDGVGIDRDTGTARESIKFDYEAVSEGATFDFRLTGENLDDTDLGLLALGLLEFGSGESRLGGIASRGLGAFTLTLEPKVEYFDDAQKLLTYLSTRAYPTIGLGELLRPKFTAMIGGGC